MDIRGLFRRGRRREDAGRAVDEELAFHLDAMVEELVEEGMSPEDARREARRRFGDVKGTRAYCIDQQTGLRRREGRMKRLDDIGRDVAYALRTLRRSPGYAAVVIVTLALGIAANTVIFSLLNPYFLRALPYEEPDRLVQLGHIDARYGWDGARFSLQMLEDYEARSRAFSALAAYRYGTENVTGPEGPERIQVAYLTADMFEVLGADPRRGRTFLPGEDGPGGAAVVVLDQGLWQRRWAGDPSVIGRTVSMDGVPHEIIGVMPPDFVFPFGGVKMWTPIRTDPVAEPRSRAAHLIVGRLAPGWDRERARQELQALHAAFALEHPDADGRYAGISVKGMREALNFAWEVMRLSFGILLAAVLAVLAIACVNVASLTLARAGARSREIAVRASLGAGRGRLVRQMVTESLVLALAGGLLGVAGAHAAVGAMGSLLPEDLYRVGEVTVDGTVLAFTLVVTLLTPLLFGLTPALGATRVDLARSLRDGARKGTHRTLRSRRVLVVAQVALAVVLVTATGLTLRSLKAVQAQDLGYDADRLLTVEITPPESRYPAREDVDGYFMAVTERLGALPGVEAVGQVYPLPMNHENIPVQYAVPGREPPEGDPWPTALQLRVGPGYFASMGTPLMAGRSFDATSASSASGGGAPEVVIGRALAERAFGDADPVGRSLLLDADDPTPARVVGVVGDIVHSGFEDGASPDLHVYRPLPQAWARRRFVTLRTDGPPSRLTAPVREILLEADPDLPAGIRPMDDVVRESTYQWSLGSAFLGAFGAVAIFLAGLGVYGLIAYSVSQRRGELGIRMAVGAGSGQIRALVIREGLALTVMGCAVGLGLALAGGAVISGFLYGVEAFDPWTLGGVAVLFMALAAVASAIPAFRAGTTDPSEALRAG